MSEVRYDCLGVMVTSHMTRLENILGLESSTLEITQEEDLEDVLLHL